MNKLAIAIDGPSGAGKSTVAKEVAALTGIIYIDTGAMYRAVALYNLECNRDVNDRNAVEGSLNDITIDIRHDESKKQRLILNGKDVTDNLRTQNVAEATSIVASYPAVRQKLVALQQSLAEKHSVVMDGRDIGTYVLPNAQVKIYLDASIDKRVRRRIHELEQLNQPVDYNEIRRAIELRDYRDMNRRVSPLVKAEDAHYIHSDNMTVKEIAKEILEKIRILRQEE